jgi:membrane-associated phospholipid phosphatase
MTILMNIYDEFGNFGPIIIIILSMYLLWNQNNLFLYYIIGTIIDSILNIVLKGIIQEPRPIFNSKEINLALKNNKRFLYKDGIPYDLFGMPSGHTSSSIFSTIFIFLALRKIKWFYVYLLISFIIISQRVIYQHHTISQVIVGAFIGTFVAYIIYQLAEKNIKGRIREKSDDYGPI